MYDVQTLSKILQILRDFNSLNEKLSNSVRNNFEDKVLIEDKNQIIRTFENLDIILKTDDEYYVKFFAAKINKIKMLLNEIFSDSFFHNGRFSRYLKTKDQKNSLELVNSLVYLNQELNSKLLATCNHIIPFYNFDDGNATPMELTEISEYEIYGPIRQIISDIKFIVKIWARKNKMNCVVWLAGSALDGVSPVKGLFFERNFVAYKPIDYKKISDIDIGIGLDRITYGDEVPAVIQSKGKLRIGNVFGKKILSISSESIDKQRLGKLFKPEHISKYVELMEMLEPLILRKISLKDRQIHFKFNLIDERMTESDKNQLYQRQFVIFDNFKQSAIPKDEASMQDIVKLLVKKTFNENIAIEQYIMEIIAEDKLEKKTIKIEGALLANRFGVAKKKGEQIMSDVYDALKKSWR